jgi:hypothetical protein
LGGDASAWSRAGAANTRPQATQITMRPASSASTRTDLPQLGHLRKNAIVASAQ